MSPLISINSFSSAPPRTKTKAISFLFSSCRNDSLPISFSSINVHTKLSNRGLNHLNALDPLGEPGDQVEELRVPQAWSSPSIALQESEWLRETLHKWLDEEYCPEPTNIEISRIASKSYYESLVSNETDLGEILLKMATDLESISYRESFHGAFSSANAAVRLITQKMESLTDQ